MLSILAVGQDSRLLATRAEVLRQTGADVVQAGSSGAVELLEKMRFDVVVLCHTVNAKEAEAIGWAAHRPDYAAPVLQVLPIAKQNASSEAGIADAMAESDPAQLVAKVVALLNAVERHAPGFGPVRL